MVCNDISKSRMKRIERVTKEYFYNTSAFNKLTIKQSDATRINEKSRYNKVSCFQNKNYFNFISSFSVLYSSLLVIKFIFFNCLKNTIMNEGLYKDSVFMNLNYK